MLNGLTPAEADLLTSELGGDSSAVVAGDAVHVYDPAAFAAVGAAICVHAEDLVVMGGSSPGVRQYSSLTDQQQAYLTLCAALGGLTVLMVDFVAANAPTAMEVLGDEVTRIAGPAPQRPPLDGDGTEPEPEPEPAAAGAGMIPPGDRFTRCPDLTDDRANEILNSLPMQRHHIATQYDTKDPQARDWATEAEATLRRYGLDHLKVRGFSKAAEWNLRRLPHQGSHPDVYKEWVLENLEEAARWSKQMADENAPAGDPELYREIQMRYFEQAWQAVRHWVTQDPLMIRHEYHCRGARP